MGVEKVKREGRKHAHYSESFKLKVLKDYMENGLSRKEASKKYNLNDASIISHWVRKFGIDKSSIKNEAEVVVLKRAVKSDRELGLEFRIKELEKRLSEKEREVSVEKLRTRALSTMIDVAEEQLHIQIRKKAGAKQ
jgi:transposase-like protein